ncbi:hypothetical protein [Geomicrobium sediminis]|uniref:Membrane protein n=1 Tax=Geomicrobium sediminis TaxID=1347788 RepID=A0ABS2PHD2_9BACL|nr:hypothetical protein [Geomicrobium sediminis]MBM7634356.1 putative membrane protein [Geomicrobium sediminis]
MITMFRTFYSMILFVAGVLHFTHEKLFRSIVPKFLPFRRLIVLVSGVMELAFSVLLWVQKGQKLTGKLLALFMIIVFPANIYMAAKNRTYINGKKIHPVFLWLRLPLQIPLILGALYVTGHSKKDDVKPKKPLG